MELRQRVQDGVHIFRSPIGLDVCGAVDLEQFLVHSHLGDRRLRGNAGVAQQTVEFLAPHADSESLVSCYFGLSEFRVGLIRLAAP